MRRIGGLIIALALSACAPATPGAGPRSALPYGPAIVVRTTPAPLDPTDAARTSLADGAVVYAGGLILTSNETTRLHGLSDLRVWPDGRLLAVSDEGDLFEGRLVLDPAGRLAGFRDGRLHAVQGEDGQPVAAHGKPASDAEGLAELADGARLISFEENDRILAYRPGGGPPGRAPIPPASFPFNQGMEALAEYPAAGPDAYLVGGEASGQIWVCRLSAGCTADRPVAKPKEFGLTALATLPDGRFAYLLRAYDPLRGARARIGICCGTDGMTIGEFELASPYNVDNFEGLAALPGPDGRIRIYLISDDNFSSRQRTLLLAFDWRPPEAERRRTGLGEMPAEDRAARQKEKAGLDGRP